MYRDDPQTELILDPSKVEALRTQADDRLDTIRTAYTLLAENKIEEAGRTLHRALMDALYFTPEIKVSKREFTVVEGFR